MKITVVVFVAVLIILILPVNGYDSINIENNIPEESDCDSIPEDLYNEFREAVGTVLGSSVVDDIDSQIENRTSTSRKVTVQIFFVDKEEFRNEYADDNDRLQPGRTREELMNEADRLFEQNEAYTYLTDSVRGGVQVVKVKFFCKDSLRMSIIDNRESAGYDLYDLIVHELVHVKLYSIYLLYGEEPFQDHDDDFFREIRRLKQKLLDEIIPEEEGNVSEKVLGELVEKYNSNYEQIPWVVKAMLGNEKIDVHILQTSTGKTSEADFNLMMSGGRIQSYSMGPGEKSTMKMSITKENFIKLMESEDPGSTFVSMYKSGEIQTEEIGMLTKIKFSVGRLLMKIFM